jgi:hypothetical protein
LLLCDIPHLQHRQQQQQHVSEQLRCSAQYPFNERQVASTAAWPGGCEFTDS